MFRYAKLYMNFIKFSFGKAVAYRFDFWCRIVMDLAYYAVSIGFFKVIFLKTSSLGGWREDQVMVFVGCHLILDALQMTLISSNLWSLPSAINRGELDYYLVKPVSELFFLSFREVAINSVVNLAIAIGFFVWALSQYKDPFAWHQLISLVMFMGVGFLLYYSFRLLVSLPVFWTHAPYGFERVFYSMLPFMERPDTIFRGPVRLLILTAIPFGLVVSMPVRIFFEGVTFEKIALMVGVTAVFFLFVKHVWNRGLRAYASASS